MAKRNRSPEDSLAGAARARRSVRRAGALLAGAALAMCASFLPLGQAAYPPQGGDPGTTATTIPAQPLLALAQVHPHGARGGYVYLIETHDFSVKVLGNGIPHRSGLYVELRSHFLHTHPEGVRGACEEALYWLREQLLYDQDVALVQASCTFEAVRLSRVDLHADWQGGWVPSAALGEGLQLITPARVTWHAYHDGATFNGFVFGPGSILAWIYNKSLQARHQATLTTRVY
jgi:hypothetical protein